jgi:hypothetical protein
MNAISKQLIGLSGIIATGMSIARLILEHMGDPVIGSNAPGHRAITEGTPGHSLVLVTLDKGFPKIHHE